MPVLLTDCLTIMTSFSASACCCDAAGTNRPSRRPLNGCAAAGGLLILTPQMPGASKACASLAYSSCEVEIPSEKTSAPIVRTQPKERERERATAPGYSSR
jgi:hypothetical protein